MKIVVDTREQRPLPFRVVGAVKGIVKKKLDVGDYSIEGFEDKISFERKSAMDLYQTLGRGNARFQKELVRGKDYDFIGIIVEDSFSCVRDKAFKESHRTKMRPDVVCKILWALMFKYDVHVFFCNTPGEASSVIRQVFEAYLRWKQKVPKVPYRTTIEMVRAINKLKRRCGFK